MRNLTKNGKLCTQKVLLIIGASCLVLVTVAVCCLMAFASQMTGGDKTDYSFVVVLDAGHGGIDGGVVGGKTKVKESDLNLQVTYLLQQEFLSYGFPVVLTRKDKNGLYGDATPGFKKRDMKSRRETIVKAKANLVISVHMNRFPLSSRSGPQIFFNAASESGKKLADKMQMVLNDFTKNTHAALKGDYFMLKCTTSPSVIVECGFLSNADDEAKLIDPSYQKKIARKIFEGALLYMSSAGINQPSGNV